MDLEFASIELQKLFTDSQGAEKYKESAYKGFLVVTTLMLNAVTLKDLSIFRRKNFEELKGARRGEYSLRLDQQYRIIFRFNPDRTSIVVLGIEDYH